MEGARRVRVVGVDPGIATAGYGVVERAAGLRPCAYGALHTQGATPDRLVQLRASLLELIDAHRPVALAMERLFFNRNARTAMAVGQAAGVMMAAAAERGVEVFEYTPLEVKQAVTGTGAAPKEQVQRMVATLLGLGEPLRPIDAADACAVAICHLNRSRYANAVAEARR